MTDSAAARFWGVEEGYHDIFGKWHETDLATLSSLIDAVSAGRAEPSAPPRPEHMQAFQGDGSRRWGLAVQLYAVRSASNWGIGDFSDLLTILDVAAWSGADAVGINPLHALFLDRPENASPYAPNSRLFINPLYIDVTAIPEFYSAGEPVPADRIEELRASNLIDYAGVAALKERMLRVAYYGFYEGGDAGRKAAFAAFRTEQGEKLKRFSCFEALRRRFRQVSWRDWPEPWRSADPQALAELRASEDRECGFHEFLQWTAYQQLAACKLRARERGMDIGLYLDLAVGVDAGGADSWSNQRAVLSSYSVGAPPDEFNPGGQDWGLAPFNPHVLADNDFAVFRELLGATMRHAGAVRLDHVLGLMRLFLVPHGAHPSQGAYIRFPFERLLRVIAEESHRYRCVFIGEDLGTVPEGFRETAARWGVWSYRVMMFERGAQGEFKPPQDYPAQALATFTTHDLSTFRGWTSGEDLNIKRAIGINPGENEASRQRARDALKRALDRLDPALSPEDFSAIAFYLATTPARLVMVGAEDMFDMVEQVNVPGTTDQHPNWRRKLPVAVEKWAAGETWRNVTAAFERAGRNKPRSPATPE